MVTVPAIFKIPAVFLIYKLPSLVIELPASKFIPFFALLVINKLLPFVIEPVWVYLSPPLLVIVASLPFLTVPEINNAPVPSFLINKFLALSITPEIVAVVPLLLICRREPLLSMLPPTFNAPALFSISNIPPLVISAVFAIVKPFEPLVWVTFK